MNKQAIPRTEWTTYLDQFSLDHLGATVSLETSDPASGDRVVARDQTFRGISADQKDGENRISIMMGARNDDTTTHSVMAPEEVWRSDAEGSIGESLSIGTAQDNVTKLRF